MPDFDLDQALTPPPVRYKVEMNSTFGWDDAEWTESDGDEPSRPMTFASRADAFREIFVHCKDCREAVARGDMDSAPEPVDFRVVPVEVPGA